MWKELLLHEQAPLDGERRRGPLKVNEMGQGAREGEMRVIVDFCVRRWGAGGGGGKRDGEVKTRIDVQRRIYKAEQSFIVGGVIWRGKRAALQRNAKKCDLAF